MDHRILNIWAKLPDPKTVECDSLQVPILIKNHYSDEIMPSFSSFIFKKKRCGKKVLGWEFPYNFINK